MKRGVLTLVATHMNSKNVMLDQRSHTKDHILYDRIYMKSPEQANLWRHTVDEWLPRIWGVEGEGK